MIMSYMSIRDCIGRGQNKRMGLAVVPLAPNECILLAMCTLFLGECRESRKLYEKKPGAKNSFVFLSFAT